MHLGVNVKMVTGDHLLIAKQTAKTLNMGTKIFTSENLPMLDPETKQKPPDLGKTYGKKCALRRMALPRCFLSTR